MLLVLGLLRQQEKTDAILQKLRSNKFYRSAVMYISPTGKPIVRQNSLPRISHGLTSGFIASLAFASAAAFGFPIIAAGLIGCIFFAITWVTTSKLLSGINKPLLKQYLQRLQPNQTLIVIRASEYLNDKAYLFLQKTGCEPHDIVSHSLTLDLLLSKLDIDKFKSERLPTSEGLRNNAVRLATAHHNTDSLSSKPKSLLKISFSYERILSLIQKNLTANATAKELLPANWLLDNSFLMHSEFAYFRHHYLSQYDRSLPVLAGSYRINQRIYNIALSFLQQTNFQFNQSEIVDFLEAYQTAQALTAKELEIFPLLLRFVLIEEIIKYAVQSEKQSIESQYTRLFANQLKTEPRPNNLSTVADLLQSLNHVSALNWNPFFERLSQVEIILSKDPAQTYLRSDSITRRQYRQAVATIARQSQSPEDKVAAHALELAKAVPAGSIHSHIGYYLIDCGRSILENQLKCELPATSKMLRRIKQKPQTYIWGLGLFTALIFAGALSLAIHYGARNILGLIFVGLLALIPAYQLAAWMINYLIEMIYPCPILPKLQLADGIPQQFRTLVVTPVSLEDKDSISEYLENLEIQYLANQDPNLGFALLCGDSESIKTRSASLSLLQKGIEDLNAHFGNKFFLFDFPEMSHHQSTGNWDKLNEYLSSRTRTPEPLKAGVLSALGEIRFIIKLNIHTQLPYQSAKELIATLAHPLNHFENQERGYAFIQPHIDINISSTIGTFFKKLFSNVSGTFLDPQINSVSCQILFAAIDCQDQFIYDLETLAKIKNKNFDSMITQPLSAGYAHDIKLTENCPSSYSSYCRALYKRSNQNWQANRTWLNDKNKFNYAPIDNWKLFDNFVHNALPIFAISLLLASWLLPSVKPSIWAALIALILAGPVLFAAALGPHKKWITHRQIRQLGCSIAFISVLPHQAWITLDTLINGRTQREASDFIHASVKQMIWAPFISFLLICILILANFIWWEIALPFILLWAASPLLIWALHEYRHVPEAKIITASDRAFLRQLARRTWRYFDDNVTEEFSSLPPAYTLEQPHAANARYTTPAAIGYWLSSLASAQDFGFITPQQFITRASATLDTIGEGLRQEGHLLNQYTIENLAPCEPRVISSSESAALITSLWVFIEACNEMIDKPIIDATALQGLADTVTMLKEASKDAKELSGPVITLTTIFNDAPDDLDKIVQRIKLAVRPTKQLIESLKTENSPHGPALYWAEKLQSQLAMWVSYIDLYLPWVNFLKAATSDSMVMMDPACSALRDQLLLSGISLNALAQKKMLLLSRLNSMGSRTKWDMHICNQFDESSNAANAIIDQLRKLISVAENYAQAIDMKVFHNSENNLLSQHYDISKKKAGPPVRDFLISESRLSSFIAIAHSDVPVKHWPNLIKAYHSLNGKRTLLSLNGAINDYLAPFLFMKNYDHSEIEEAARTALKCQIDYALERNIPWGIAKTAYVSDNELQFETNGISGLGVKCDTSTKTTISPYSTLLALAIYPALAIKNLKNLVNLNMLGEKGFYESISFAESDSDADSTNEITYLYTAEHQGINLISINNALHNNVMQTRFHKNLRVRTHQALLFTQKQPAYSPTHWGFFPAFSWFTTLAFKPV